MNRSVAEQAIIRAAARKLARRGVRVAAVIELDLKRVVGVQAPQARSAASGRFRRGVTPATPGAPPRRITGKGLTSIKVWFDPESQRFKVSVGKDYMLIHEAGNHKWLRKTLWANDAKYRALMVG